MMINFLIYGISIISFFIFVEINADPKRTPGDFGEYSELYKLKGEIEGQHADTISKHAKPRPTKISNGGNGGWGGMEPDEGGNGGWGGNAPGEGAMRDSPIPEEAIEIFTNKNFRGNKDKLVLEGGSTTPCTKVSLYTKGGVRSLKQNQGSCVRLYPTPACNMRPNSNYNFDQPGYMNFAFENDMKSNVAFAYSGCGWPAAPPKEDGNGGWDGEGLKNLNLFNGETIAVNINKK